MEMKKITAIMAFLTVFPMMISAGSFGAKSKPEIKKGPYISWDDDPQTTMTISWETNIPIEGKLAYGLKDKINYILLESNAGTLHHLRIKDLKPGTRYYYQILNVTAPVCSFETAPKESRDFKFVVYGDTRTYPQDHARVVEAITKYQPEFILHTGDYIQDGRKWDQWQEFFDITRTFSSSIPMLSVIGNHEKTADNYLKLFDLPGNEQWYSFDYLNAHFVFLNNEEDFKKGSLQHQWFEADLKQAKPKSKWLFIIQHRQTFSSGKRGSDKEILENLEPLFREYKADIVFCGHEHFYERQRQGGINYIITGGGGAPLYEVNPGDSTFHAESSLHYCQVEISDSLAKVRMVRIDGTMPDSLVLKK